MKQIIPEKVIDENTEYYWKIFHIGIPLVFQKIITTGVRIADNIMLGSLGDVTIAATTVSSQILFIFESIVFGSVSGIIIINAQLFGRKDFRSIKKVTSIASAWCTGIGILFMVLIILFTEDIAGLFSSDTEVIRETVNYLKILSVSFVFFACSQIYSGTLRCLGKTFFLSLATCLALITNIALNYILIFGHCGFPAMGITGAAIATLAARIVEFLGILLYYLFGNTSLAACKGEPFFIIDRQYMPLVLSKIIPLTLNEGIYGIGRGLYTTIYGHLSTSSIAAVGAVTPIDDIMYTFIIGIANASAVIIGNSLGEKNETKTDRYASMTIRLMFLIGLIIGLIVFSFRTNILRLFALSGESLGYARCLLAYLSLFLCFRSTNYVIMIGILRAGGDIIFCFIVDIAGIWLVGLPFAAISTFVFHQSITVVYLAVLAEMFSKLLLFYKRYRSGTWKNYIDIKNIEKEY